MCEEREVYNRDVPAHECSCKLELSILTYDDSSAPLEGAEWTSTFSTTLLDNGEAFGVLMKTKKSSTKRVPLLHHHYHDYSPYRRESV